MVIFHSCKSLPESRSTHHEFLLQQTEKKWCPNHSVSNDLTHHFCCFSIRHPELRTAAAAIWGAPALPRFCWMVRLIRILSGSSRGRPHGSPPAMRWDLEGWRSMKNPSILMWTTGVKGFDSQPSFLFLGISLCQHWVFAVVFFSFYELLGADHTSGTVALWLFNIAMENHHVILVGGWPTHLKNDGVKVSWDDYSISNCFWKVIKFHGSSQHQAVIFYPFWIGLL